MKKVVILIFLSLIIGCAPLETVRLFDIGVTRFKTQGKIEKKIYEKDLLWAYQQTEEIIKSFKARPYRGTLKKRFIIADNFKDVFVNRCLDTTQVAVFFQQLNDTQVEITVSSLNFNLSVFIAEKIFSELDKRV